MATFLTGVKQQHYSSTAQHNSLQTSNFLKNTSFKQSCNKQLIGNFQSDLDDGSSSSCRQTNKLSDTPTSLQSSYNIPLPPETFLTPSYDSQSFDVVPTVSTATVGSSYSPGEEFNVAARAQAVSTDGLVPLLRCHGYRIIPHLELNVAFKNTKSCSRSRCSFPHHYTTQGLHKKLYFFQETYERVEARRLLRSPISCGEFETALCKMFPELLCYKHMDIIFAAFPSPDYRKRWIVVEEDVTKQRILHHRDVREELKIRFKRLMGTCTSFAKLKASLSTMPVFRYMTVYDVMMTVYSAEFYKKNALFRQCGQTHITELTKRIAERFRLRENGINCPAASHVDPNGSILTDEQKFVVVGLVQQRIEVEDIQKKLASLFVESFSARSTRDILEATFGPMLSFCVDFKTGTPKTVVELKPGMKRQSLIDGQSMQNTKKKKKRGGVVLAETSRIEQPVKKKKKKQGIQDITQSMDKALIFNLEQGAKI